MEFKDKLKELRKKAKVSQSELAEAIFMSRSAVAKWESGLGLPSEESLQALCTFFGVERGELLGSPEAESALVGKNQIISRQKITLICAVALTVVLALTILFTSVISFGGSSPSHVVVDGIIYERNGWGTALTVVGAEKKEKRGIQYYKRSLYIADYVEGLPVTAIGQYAFYDMSFEEVRIGANVETIEYGAFYKCEIRNFSFDDCVSLKIIGEIAFRQCEGLSELQFPSTLEVIENSAFSDSTIGEVTFASDVKIEPYAFANTRVRRLTFEGAAILEEWAFSGCHWLEKLMFRRAEVAFPKEACAFPNEYFNFINVEYAGTYEEWQERAGWERFRCIDEDGYYLLASDFEGFISYYSNDGLVES